MFIKNILNIYNLLLSMGSFYGGALMLLGRGAFDTFPPEWIGQIPFNSWTGIALFGIIIFGIGNAIASAYGFVKKDKKVFIITISMGALLFFCTFTSNILLGEWYLPTGFLLILSIIQMLIGLLGLFTKKLLLTSSS